MSHSSVTLICFTSLAACSRLLPAQDLSLIRAATQQRMSLLRTLDAEFRVWEDADARMGFDGPAADADNVCRIRWITDRGRVLLEVSQGGFTNRLVYEDRKSVV